MNEHPGIVDVDHAARRPSIQSFPVETLVFSLEIVCRCSLFVRPVQRLHGYIGAAHDELADRVQAVVWDVEVEKVNLGEHFRGVVGPTRLTDVHLCWDSGWFIVVVAVDIMVYVFLLLLSACPAVDAWQEKLTTQ